MSTPLKASAFELMYGGSFKNFKPETLDAAGITALSDNKLYQSAANGRYGIKISGTAYEFAHVADLADFATETFVTDAVDALETAIKGGVAADGDTLAKLRALIAALDSTKADASTVSTLSTTVSDHTSQIAGINALLASDDLNLDEMQELVNYMKANKNFLDSLAISNIAGLQVALDSKVSQVSYDARVTAVDALIASKVDQTVYDDRVTAVDTLIASKLDTATYTAGQATQDGRLTDNEAAIAALQALTSSIQTSQVAYVDVIVDSTAGTSIAEGFEYGASVPASKKIQSVTVEVSGSSWGGYERVDEQNVRVVTPESIGSDSFRFMMAYVPN